MSIPSIGKQILGTRVITGDSNRIQTDRIQNPDAMMCPVWGGSDLAGRQVSENSFVSKKEGCHASLDRIKVENNLRPAYTNYVTISAAGIAGENANYGPNTTVNNNKFSNEQRKRLHNNNPHFGLVSSQAILPSSGRLEVNSANAYQSADMNSVNAQNARTRQNLNIGSNSQQTYNRMNSGRVNPNTTSTVNQYANYAYKNTNTNSQYATVGSL